MLIYSDIIKILKKTFLLLLLISFSLIRAQQIIVYYETISPPIFPIENMPYIIGFLDFNTSGADSNFTEEFYKAFKADTTLLSKFIPYPFSSIKQVKDKLRIDSFSPVNSDLQKKLLENLKIKYLVSGEILNRGFYLVITSTESGKVLFSNSYYDSDYSTAVKDALKLFSSGITAKYKKRGTLTVSVTPSDAKFTIDLIEQNERSNIYLNPGIYIIEFEKEGYYPLKERIEVQEGVKIEKEFHLVPSFGSIKFDVSPSDLTIKMISQQDTTITKEWSGNEILNNVQTGLYDFEFSRIGFQGEKRKFRVKPEETLEEKISLTRLFYTVEDISCNNMKVYGLRVEPGEKIYKIHYNILGKPDDRYDVRLYLLNKDASSNINQIKNVKGDIGKNIPSGMNKTIIWDVEKDFPRQIQRKDYMFYLEVD